MRYAATKTKGFTLVELVTVITIIGVLAVVAGPRFFSTEVYHERFYADDVLAALRYARRTAETSNCPVRFRSLTNGFDLTQDSSCFSGGASNFNLTVARPSEPDQAYSSTERPSTLSQASTSGTIFFQPSGSVLNSSNNVVDVTLTLTGSEVITTIRIEGGSGYVSSN